MFDRNDIEEIILSMAGIVMENRVLRNRNAELEKEVKEYIKRLYQDVKDSEEMNKELLRTIFKGTLAMHNVDE